MLIFVFYGLYGGDCQIVKTTKKSNQTLKTNPSEDNKSIETGRELLLTEAEKEYLKSIREYITAHNEKSWHHIILMKMVNQRDLW